MTYTSADGTEVRMFILSPSDGPDRPRPTILYGYGGFGIPMHPGYSATMLAWVAAGGVYAVACLRGGGEEGEEWHRAGMLGSKQNVFDDFHAAAEWLQREGWTTREQLAINGGSNGGLLVGAALTQRPDLYGTVVCAAPLLDMVRYVTSELGRTWTVEYGDPDVPEELDWLLAYSPYHNVAEGRTTRRRCSWCSATTRAPTRCTGASCAPRCSTPPAASARSSSAPRRTWATEPARCRSRSTRGAEMLAFTARWTGLELA